MDSPRHRRALMALAWSCVVAGILMLAVLSQQVGRTSDEVNYLMAGRTLAARQPLATQEMRFQGPLMLLATQITAPTGKPADDLATLRRARLGMLVFPALLFVVLLRWSRAVLGERAALLTVFLAATNPTLLAFGPLLSSDIPFTAMELVAAWSLWRWLQTSRWRDLLLLGISLGGFAATKYTSLLLIAAFVPLLGIAVLTGFDATPPGFGGSPRRLPLRVAAAALALAIAGAVALVTLYACYLFASPPFGASSASTLASGPLRALAALPLGPQLLGLLPQPLVLGVDFQAVVATQRANGTFFDLVGNHWAYYPMSLLLKTPVATLGLVVLALGSGWRRWPATRRFWSCVLVPPLVLLVYCSATRSLQMGVRYLLPMVPALLLLAGSWTRSSLASSRLGRLLLVLVVASSSWLVVQGWPCFLGYFNSLGGGLEAGYRVCFDGNCDWLQRREAGQEALQARHAQATFLLPGEGPRFGLIGVYTADLKARDPEDATHTYHWLTRFEPVDHDFAAWLLYDVTPAAFERCIAAGDRRAGHDLAIAFVRQGDFAAARQALASVAGGDARDEARSRRVAEVIELVAAVAGGDESKRALAVVRLQAAGQADLALSLFVHPQRSDAKGIFLLLFACGRVRDAVDSLERAGADGSRTAEEAFLLAKVVYEGTDRFASDPARAQRLLDAGPAPPAGSPLATLWEELQQKIHHAVLWYETGSEKR